MERSMRRLSNLPAQAIKMLRTTRLIKFMPVAYFWEVAPTAELGDLLIVVVHPFVDCDSIRLAMRMEPEVVAVPSQASEDHLPICPVERDGVAAGEVPRVSGRGIVGAGDPTDGGCWAIVETDIASAGR